LIESQKDTFNQIAPGWYNYRHHSIFTAELNRLAKRWQSGSLLNLGCAHGPDFIPFRDSFKLYGVDYSIEMIALARKYSAKFNFNVELKLADVRQLPYPDKYFDWAISIATYHHIKGGQEISKALEELKRVLKPGGEAFITSWNRWQRRFWFKPRELYVPWRKKDKILYRYYHLFSYTELEKLATRAEFIILESFPESAYKFPLKYFSRNICLLIKKAG
jgi:ubiquinone/menaquinone biosynthesis C-methylase UbiE